MSEKVHALPFYQERPEDVKYFRFPTRGIGMEVMGITVEQISFRSARRASPFQQKGIDE